jgi:hypothetical protein
MSTYVVLFRGGLPKEKLTDEYLSRFANWAKDVSKDLRLGNRLRPEGKLISGKNGEKVSDVEFSSSLVGGYVVIEANDYDTAVSKLKACPIFENGGSVEVREILPVQGLTH